ncbi:unnamed protein product (macronuclear) [Paramecium tetraurelia]|uniref:Uncharacterized protein n=1 Tax=Paramecium tetraurelia TaxID=5888 RepID=A0DQ88_PARTE|nr:uncharacterized protein GSPATT00002605001 [Paramecium tetraurelia]CAK85205.1 unnamed protein product [Paramecium tetraurelia]|eukprot:XP_001452602.1 hypothetical protein (macronuclear) [Paramecium tetraurelia strain d4-2]
MQMDESNKTKKNDQPILKETSKNRNVLISYISQQIINKLQGNPLLDCKV